MLKQKFVCTEEFTFLEGYLDKFKVYVPHKIVILEELLNGGSKQLQLEHTISAFIDIGGHKGVLIDTHIYGHLASKHNTPIINLIQSKYFLISFLRYSTVKNNVRLTYR